MSLNIGTLVGYLQLDDANFERKADAADRKINALQLHLQALAKENPKISVEVDAQTAQLDELKLKLAALKEQAASGADVRVDAVQALIELDRVQTKIRELHGKTVRVEVDVDKSQIAEGTSVLEKFGGSLSVLPALAVAAGAALIPVVGVITGLVAALAAPLAFAAGGAGLFAIFGAAAVKQTEAQQTKLTAAKKSLDSARQSLANAQASAATSAQNSLTSAQASADASIKSAKQAEAAATTAAGRHAAQQRIAAAEATLATRRAAIASGSSASVASAQRRVNEALKVYQQELRGVSPQQHQFLSAMGDLKSTFSDMLKGPTGNSVLTVLTDGVQLLTYVLRASGPLVRAASSAFASMLTDLNQAVSSPGFAQFLHMASGQIRTDLLAFGHILGNVGRGLGGLFSVLAGSHFSGSVLQGLTHLSREFANWGNSKSARRDVRDLFEYVHKVGPQVGSTLGAIARAAGHLVSALAPLGPPVLKVVEGIANALSKIPVPVLTALAAAFVAMTAASKVGKGLSALGGLSGLTLGGGGVGGKMLGGIGVQKVYVVNLPPGGGIGGPGGIVGDAERGGKFAPLALAPEVGVLGAAAYVDYKGGKSAYNSVRQSASQFAFGQAAPTVGGPSSGNHLDYGKLMMEANGYFKSTTDHWDAVKQHAADASRQIDMIGPHAAAAFGAADRDVDVFRSKLAAIQDKRLSVILQDQAAIQSLEALQRMRIADKSFSVTARYQQIERTVGPGGGIGHHALGGWIAGPGSGMSDSVPFMGSNGEFVVRAAQAAANAPLLQAINNGSGRVSLASASGARGGYRSAAMPARYALTITNWDEGTGHIEAIASDSHAADHRYATAVGRK